MNIDRRVHINEIKGRKEKKERKKGKNVDQFRFVAAIEVKREIFDFLFFSFFDT